VLVHALGQVVDSTEGGRVASRWVDEWRLGRIIAETLGSLGLPHDTALHSVATIRVLTGLGGWSERPVAPAQLAYALGSAWFESTEARRYLQVNRHQGTEWFNKEAFEELLAWTLLTEIVVETASREADGAGGDITRRVAPICAAVQRLDAAKEASGYRVEALLEELRRA